MEIAKLRWLPANEEKLRQHGITRDEVESVLARDEWVVLRHPLYPDQARIIGPTLSGRLITVAMEPTEPTERPDEWRPVTGWESTAGETAYYWEQYR